VPIDFTKVDADPRVAAARAAYDETVRNSQGAQAVRDAERAVMDARTAQLREQVTALHDAAKADRRRMSAAQGQLTRARKSGDPERIAAAEQKLAEARERWDASSDRALREDRPLIREMYGIAGRAVDRFGELLDEQAAGREAHDALWDARQGVYGDYKDDPEVWKQ
jgi:chromosome segregation ATPase